jgi:opacity protein-like surface antigen
MLQPLDTLRFMPVHRPPTVRRREPLLITLLIALILQAPFAAAAPATAQEPGMASGAVAAALARVPPGTTVRIQTRAGTVIEGPLRLAGDSIRLEGAGDRRAVALGDVRSAWYQQRTTRTGAITGALVGAGAGGAFMGLFALVVSGSSGEKATLIGVGVLGGAAAGGLLGGVVGAAVPRWVLAYPAATENIGPAPAATERLDAAVGRRRIGSLEGSLGYGRIGGDESTDGGPGGRLALHAELGADPASARGTTTFLAVGPEISWFDLGRTDRVRRSFPAGDTLEFSRGYRALTAGGVLRGGVATGVLRTYAVLGLAYHRWDSEQHDERWISQSPEPPVVVPRGGRFEHLGYTIGAGTQAALRPKLAVGLELRRTAVGTFDMDLPGSYWSVTLSGSRRW